MILKLTIHEGGNKLLLQWGNGSYAMQEQEYTILGDIMSEGACVHVKETIEEIEAMIKAGGITPSHPPIGLPITEQV